MSCDTVLKIAGGASPGSTTVDKVTEVVQEWGRGHTQATAPLITEHRALMTGREKGRARCDVQQKSLTWQKKGADWRRGGVHVIRIRIWERCSMYVFTKEV
jgi:hypothetical protein